MDNKPPLLEVGGTVVAIELPVRASEFQYKKMKHQHGIIKEKTPLRIKSVVFRIRHGTVVTLIALVEKPGALFDSAQFTYTPLSDELTVLARFEKFMQEKATELNPAAA